MKKNKYIYGRKPILDAIDHGTQFERIYIADYVRGEKERELRQKCRKFDLPLKTVPEHFFKAYKQYNHQGFLAEISPIQYFEIETLVTHTFELGKIPFLAMLDKITDVRNFGAIARSALAFGVDGLLIPIKNSAPVNDISIKTSAGALLNIPIVRYQNQTDLINLLKELGIQICATGLHTESKSIDQIDWSLPSCIIIGSEEKGVNRELIDISDEKFEIPQSDQIESLNASVAAGICFYEVSKSRPSL